MAQLVTWDSANKSTGFTLDTTNLIATSSASTSNGIRSTLGKQKGKWYWEITVLSGNPMIGILDSTITNFNQGLYSMNGTVFYYGNGTKWINGTSGAYGSTLAVNDTVSVLLDLNNRYIEFYKNGISQGSFALPTLTGNLYASLINGSGAVFSCSANFGATPFKYALPQGYAPYNNDINKTLILCSDGSYKKYIPSTILTPTMTSNILPSGTVLASSEYSSGGEGYRAFDNITTSGAWTTNSTTTGWLEYDFPSPVAIGSYSLFPQATASTRSPKNWTFEAWNGSSWIILDTQSNQTGWVDNTKKTYNITNSTSYLKYRINVSANNGDSTYLSIGEMQLFGLGNFQTVTSSTPTQAQFLSDGIDDLSIIPQSAWQTLAQTSPQIQLVQYIPTGNVILDNKQTYSDIQKDNVTNSVPLGQIVIEDTEIKIVGDFKQIISTNLDFGNFNGTVRYALSFDNGLMWYAYKSGAWKVVSLNTTTTFKANGMTVTELNTIPPNEIVSKAVSKKVKFAYLLEEDKVVNDYAQIDKVQISTNVGTNTTKINQLSMYLLNTIATINLSLQGAKLTGNVSDADLTRVQYRILLNGNSLYPVNGSFTTLQPSPANINFSIPQDRILFNQNNTVRVEFQDFYGQTDYWEQTFFGQYYGLMIKDKDGNYMSDNIGTPLKFVDFGLIISGQVTLAQRYKVANSYGYDLRNVVIKPKYEYNEPRAVIQISPTDSPFIEQSEMIVGNMANGQEIDFYVRVATGFDAEPISLANFEIQVTGDKV